VPLLTHTVAVGAEADSAKIEQLLAELSGKDLAAVIAAGSAKLASVPSGGGGGGGGAAPAAGGAPAAGKKEEKKVRRRAGGGALAGALHPHARRGARAA
jgi:ribosomal protein L12E/L44/L45/RPP1/RPP2